MQPLSINHQSQFPAVTISFNLAPGAALGRCGERDQQARAAQMGVPIDPAGQLPGHRAGVPVLAGTEPYLIAAALITVYIILGMLYESYILPLTILSTLPSAGVGALLMLMASRIRAVGDRADRHHPADRHREEERHHDGGLRHHTPNGATALTPLDAIRQACLLRFRPILMTTMAALLSGLPLMLESGAGSELRQPLGYRHGGWAGC